MLMLPSMQAVVQTAEQPLPSVLQLSFSEPSFNTHLRFSEGRITGVRSALLPSWSSSLLRLGVNTQAVVEAQLRSRKVDDVLASLIETGHLEAHSLAQLVRLRTLGSLLPLVWRSGLMEVSSTPSHTVLPLTSADTLQSVSAAEYHASALSPSEQALTLNDHFTASPLASTESLGSEEARTVYLAALHGLSLGETAQRHGLRWDALTKAVTHLTAAGALRPVQAGKRAREVAGRLKVGEVAPEFCLPDFGGGEVRLSDLRGKKIWLIFNRQSTCALCNPHHLQIIALSERMRQQGVQIVSVWGSTVADLALGIGKLRPPYPVLADPLDETYDRYGLDHSLRGFLDLRNLPTALSGLKMMGTSALKDDGELTRMPAEFLIGADGTIEAAHYNSYGADWLSVERVLEWAGKS
ncbi:hypothetical protein EHF33_02400 [Deinococcus psychrotolerans]|uniref:Thioredoxin domain-containing protein n=1 Tax=Deinococcus psychrotolerans TaxID=2489213 RepID=A0A3G8Y8P1_9DEIO|nr:redoxin domain-containing protein [Deinococcus psychrotolerans]AZI41738.1 hypothetical protein EHF33_02400 [Deinococcus psychrotolerans]